MKARFITFEGVEGAGKSTQVETVAACLAQRDIPYVITREPGGTELSEAIRELLITPSEHPMSASTELLLVFAARAQHIEEVILPALNEEVWVLCDRFTDATYAYQGGGRDLPLASIATLEALVQQSLQPDLTLLFDVPVELGLERAAKRAALDRFEQQEVEFFERVRSVYLARQQQDPQRFRLIDGSQDLKEVTENVKQLFSHKLQGWLL